MHGGIAPRVLADGGRKTPRGTLDRRSARIGPP